MDLRVALMCGIDIPCVGLGVTLHQPKIKEIAFLGEQEFFTGVQTICFQKNKIQSDKIHLDDLNNFQIFMTVMSNKELLDKREAVLNAFNLFFPQYKIILSPRSLIFNDMAINKTITVDEKNFEFIQNIITSICCLRSGPAAQNVFNPANKQAEEIAEKLMKGRKKVAELNGETDISIFTQYLSILSIGLNSMSLNDLMDLTMFQLYDLLERYQMYTSWDIDIRSRLAGAKAESKLDNWMKNIH